MPEEYRGYVIRTKAVSKCLVRVEWMDRQGRQGSANVDSRYWTDAEMLTYARAQIDAEYSRAANALLNEVAY